MDSLTSSTAQRNSFDPYITILDPSTAETPNPLLDQLIQSSTSTNNEIYGETSNKTKSEKSKLFTMKRQKTKSDSEKRRESTDNSLDVCSITHSSFDSFHFVI